MTFGKDFFTGTVVWLVLPLLGHEWLAIDRIRGGIAHHGAFAFDNNGDSQAACSQFQVVL